MPVYEQLATVLRARMASGVYAQGAPLPPERVLRQEFAVGRDVVLDALAMLRAEGLLITRRGRLPMVRRQPARTYRPLNPGEQVIARMPSAPEVRRLQLDPGVPVLEIVCAGKVLELLAADRLGVEMPPP
jgi:GntR family transcriptional regulator